MCFYGEPLTGNPIGLSYDPFRPAGQFGLGVGFGHRIDILGIGDPNFALYNRIRHDMANERQDEHVNSESIQKGGNRARVLSNTHVTVK